MFIAGNRWTPKEREDSLASFLLRRPGLKSLDIQDSRLFDIWPPTSPRIPLFQLQRLLCPARIVSGIAARRLEFARLDWSNEEEPNAVAGDCRCTQAIVVALKSMTQPYVPFIYAIEDCDPVFPELLASMSRNIAYTKTLHIYMDSNHHSRNEIISHFTNYLPRFTGLLFLWLDLRLVLGTKDTADQLTVQGPGDVFSALAVCRLCFSAWRKVSGTWEKYPVDEFMALSGID
ncbi:hypothetical protein B0H17DRAFT_1301367 [Mycena rosella]|uniref:Uncharacterized protein n=1 Tax=Mycena rosella TaxID=1033263 RepID=A0AAD7DE51_MYCRO|nr:hypothetical protein B0H17DRAFT_1301367 [Mycena rosella]